MGLWALGNGLMGRWAAGLRSIWAAGLLAAGLLGDWFMGSWVHWLMGSWALGSHASWLMSSWAHELMGSWLWASMGVGARQTTLQTAVPNGGASVKESANGRQQFGERYERVKAVAELEPLALLAQRTHLQHDLRVGHEEPCEAAVDYPVPQAHVKAVLAQFGPAGRARPRRAGPGAF